MRHPIDPLLPNSRTQALKRMLHYAEHGTPPSLAQQIWSRIITAADTAAATGVAKDAARDVSEMGGRE